MKLTFTHKMYWEVIEEETGYLVMMIPFTSRKKVREDCKKFLDLLPPRHYIVQEHREKLEDRRIWKRN